MLGLWCGNVLLLLLVVEGLFECGDESSFPPLLCPRRRSVDGDGGERQTPGGGGVSTAEKKSEGPPKAQTKVLEPNNQPEGCRGSKGAPLRSKWASFDAARVEEAGLVRRSGARGRARGRRPPLPAFCVDRATRL